MQYLNYCPKINFLMLFTLVSLIFTSIIIIGKYSSIYLAQDALVCAHILIYTSRLKMVSFIAETSGTGKGHLLSSPECVL